MLSRLFDESGLGRMARCFLEAFAVVEHGVDVSTWPLFGFEFVLELELRDCEAHDEETAAALDEGGSDGGGGGGGGGVILDGAEVRSIWMGSLWLEPACLLLPLIVMLLLLFGLVFGLIVLVGLRALHLLLVGL